MTAYYNEFDRHAAAWLRELIAAGLIPAGDVDDRSILDVGAKDLEGYAQCHFFAGIGGWAYALRLAGWPEDREVWTGSCPCQSFSCAGRGRAEEDERHLWPAFRRLLSECRPPVAFGEQVASAAGRDWLGGVRADLEDLGYRVGAADLCAAGVGAPHIRQRLFWVADSAGGNACAEGVSRGREYGQQQKDGDAGGLADTECERRQIQQRTRSAWLQPKMDSQTEFRQQPSDHGATALPECNRDCEPSFWSRAIPLHCSDGKSRRVEPGIFPLVARAPGRVVRGGHPGVSIAPNDNAEALQMRLRGYGNAIVPQVAAEFVAAYMEAQ